MKTLSPALASIAALAMMASPAMGRSYELSEADPWRDADLDKRPARSNFRPRRASNRTPHIGKKERARHAGKPDGAMHGLPPLFRKGA